MAIKDQISMLHRSVNTPQRIIVAVAVPFVMMAVAYGLIDKIAYEVCSDYMSNSKPTELDKTWWMWATVFLAINVFEFFWLKTPASNETEGRQS